MDTNLPPPPPFDRREWPAIKAPLHELEGNFPADLSASTTFEERFLMVWELTKTAWALRGEPMDESALFTIAERVDRRQR